MAYIMDTNEEERAKGKTVEVGMAHFESEKNRFTILDAPGHKNYVPNMISGAAQADIQALLDAPVEELPLDEEEAEEEEDDRPLWQRRLDAEKEDGYDRFGPPGSSDIP